ncbi:MAG: pirin family protein [Xanthomonadales bacterium]|nr:pirin family protein [Xanthomonadales bacterium]
MRTIQAIEPPPTGHWVGDGFPVKSMIFYGQHGASVSPFLLLDHAGPAQFAPAAQPRGVGTHPHRGFETVTIVYSGEVEHLDSTGAGGVIGPGDVQWMTAAAGIVHQEFHSHAFTRTGGTMEMVQLWVNLPAKDKMGRPGYQTLLNRDIPVVPIESGGSLRVIAGEYAGAQGPARTHTPIDVWDIRLDEGASWAFDYPASHTLTLVLLSGTLAVNGKRVEGERLVRFARDAASVRVEADKAAKLLVLGGEPIDEPIFGHGPFVMNTRDEIVQAIEDFNAGRFGALPA